MPDLGSVNSPEMPHFHRLAPDGQTIDAQQFVTGLELGPVPGWRPYTVANFVASVDGRARIGGVSGALGDKADSSMMQALRERADALLVGTGTLAAERYGSILEDHDAQARRKAAGKLDRPLVVTSSRKGMVPFNIPLFSEPDTRVVVFSKMKVTLPRLAAQVLVELIPDGADELQFMMRRLHDRYGVQMLLCEGGPGLFGALVRANLIDELFLTLAPKLVGRAGDGSILSPLNAPNQVTGLNLTNALQHGDELLLRYRLGAAKQ